MKLERRSFLIFWDAHAWAGVIGALLLHVMFFAGAFALFYPELDRWAEARATVTVNPAEVSLDPLVKQVVKEEDARFARRLAFIFHDSGVTAYLDRNRSPKPFRFEPSSGRLVPVRSSLGTFLYELHYLDVVPYGIYLAGLAAFALFLAILTGILIHLKNLVRQWFQFRPERAARTWSSDLHKVLGVFGLPYQLLYAWTGVVLCLGSVTVSPAILASVFRGDEKAAYAAYGYGTNHPEPVGKASQVLPGLDSYVARARAAYPGFVPTWIGIEDVQDVGSHVGLYGKVPGAFGSAEMTFRAENGELLDSRGPETATAILRFDAWFYGLHYARFGGYPARYLYALLALATCVVIVTGNIVWLERRDAERAHGGNRFLERLTVGTAAGVTVATAALFATNRLLAASIGESATIERSAFGLAWLAAIAFSLSARTAPGRAAGVQLLVAAGLLVTTVVTDLALRLPASGTAVHRGVLVGLVLLAAMSAAIGAGLVRRKAPAASLAGMATG